VGVGSREGSNPHRKIGPRRRRVREAETGRVMEVLTTEPGVQLLQPATTSLGPPGVESKAASKGEEVAYPGGHAGLCLETQHFPRLGQEEPRKNNTEG